MNLTQDQLTQLLGQKELDLYALRLQVQQLQQTLAERDAEVESLKQQLREQENAA